MEYICPSGKKCYITNIMADGTVRDDMTGYVLDFDKHPDILVTFQCVYNQIQRAKKEKEYDERMAQQKKG